jgi:hypothetical protein
LGGRQLFHNPITERLARHPGYRLLRCPGRSGPWRSKIPQDFASVRGRQCLPGTFSSAQYVTDDKGNVTQVNVGGPEGFSRYFFNEFGYETRQEFQPMKGAGWTYERVRNPNSNATTEVVVRFHNATVELPSEFDVPLGEDGETRIAYISVACKKAESKR